MNLPAAKFVSILAVIFLAALSLSQVNQYGFQPAMTGTSFQDRAVQDIIVNNSTNHLTSSLIGANITIPAGITLYTNGFNLYASGSIINYGNISTGASTFSGLSYSIGGSGGGSYVNGSTGYTSQSGEPTLNKGGAPGSNNTTAGNGEFTVNKTALSYSIINQWYINGFSGSDFGGFPYYLSGSAGGSVYTNLQKALPGGKGANGIYLQAYDILNYGTINATGQPGISGSNADAITGGGGGGCILFSYGGSLVAGITDVTGGSGIHSTSGPGSGGGGNGTVLTFDFGTTPPVSMTMLEKSGSPASWQNVGTYENYTYHFLLRTASGNRSSTGYANITVTGEDNFTGTYNYTVTVSPSEGGGGYSFGTSLFIEPPFVDNVHLLLNVPQLFELQKGFFEELQGYGKIDVLTNSVSSANYNISGFAGKGISAVQNTELPGYNEYYNVSYTVNETSGLTVYLRHYVVNTMYNAVNLQVFTLNSTNLMNRSVGVTKSPVTNQKHGNSDTVYIISIAGVVLSAVIVAAVAYYLNRKKESPETQEEEKTAPALYAGSGAAEARIQELKSLLEKGVIDQSFYEESVRRLKEPADR